MKKLAALTATLLLLSLPCLAQAFLVPTNPAPQVTLAWNQASGASTYSLYYGVGSGQYTNKVTGITATNTTFTLPARGVKFFFAVTCTSSQGLESVFSNEVNYTAATPPGAPTMLPIVTLVVQNSPTSTGAFSDTPMTWPLTADQSQQFYKLRIAATQPAPAPAASLVRPMVAAPPIPSKL